MIDLYTAATPNGHKVSIVFEKLGLSFTKKEAKPAGFFKIIQAPCIR